MIVRWIVVIALAGGLLAFAFWQLPEATRPLAKGDKAVSLSLPDLTGEYQSLPAGEVTLLHFWATWCAPCRAEVPSLVKLYEEMQGKGLKILAASTDQNINDVRQFVRQYHMRFPVVLDSDMAVANRYGVTGFPETYIIDRQGVIQAHIIGPAPWQDKGLRQRLQALLDQPAPATPKTMHSTADVKQPGA